MMPFLCFWMANIKCNHTLFTSVFHCLDSGTLSKPKPAHFKTDCHGLGSFENLQMKEVPCRYECSNKLHTDYEMPRKLNTTITKDLCSWKQRLWHCAIRILVQQWQPLRLSMYDIFNLTLCHFNEAQRGNRFTLLTSCLEVTVGNCFGLHLDPNKLAHCAELKGEYLDLARSGIYGISPAILNLGATQYCPHIPFCNLEAFRSQGVIEGYNRYHQGKALRQTQSFPYNLLSLGQN